MAIFSLFPSFPSLFPRRHECHLRISQPLNRPCTFRAYSIKKPRKVKKTNAELRDDIREFVAVNGLPEGYVPSIKEFSQLGRTDLAYIVRRRGYKVIGELLGSNEDLDSLVSSNVEKCLVEDQVGLSSLTNKYEEPSVTVAEVPDVGNCSDGSQVNLEVASEFDDGLLSEGDMPRNGQLEDVNMTEEIVSPSPSEGFLTETNPSTTTVDQAIVSDDASDITLETSSMSLDEKVATVEESNSYGNSIDEGKDNVNEEEIQIVNSKSTLSKNVLNGVNANMNLNRSESKSVQLVTVTIGNDRLREDENFVVEGQSADFNKNPDDKIGKRENSVEVNHLKSMLNEKELELSRLKEQIEKEKRALSLLQAKAETEISKAQKLISEKDAELLAAEEMLSELVEVQIRYYGDGDIVEVAGSFNGWHHWIKMDPQSSSSIIDPAESRKSKLWSTVLWLYPGIYEIKFVVDGEWKIDPHMESVSNGAICNNILRVVR